MTVLWGVVSSQVYRYCVRAYVSIPDSNSMYRNCLLLIVRVTVHVSCIFLCVSCSYIQLLSKLPFTYIYSSRIHVIGTPDPSPCTCSEFKGPFIKVQPFNHRNLIFLQISYYLIRWLGSTLCWLNIFSQKNLN